MADSTNISQQIEQDSDLYSPSVYYNLLTQHHSLSLLSDPVGNQFIPVTDALYNPDAKKKLFVIGIIPPSAAVTNRTIDRSNANTIPNTTSPSTTINPGQVSGSTVQGAGNGSSGQAIDQGAAVNTTLSIKQAATAIRDAYVARFHRQPTQTELGMYVAQSYKETGDGNGGLKWPDYNPGYIGNYPKSRIPPDTNTFLHGDGRFYNAYGTAQDGAASFISVIYRTGGQAAIQAAQAGDAPAYAAALHAGGYFEDSVDHYGAGISKNQGFITGQVGNPSNLNSNLPQPINIAPSDTASSTPSWQGTGSNASATATSQAAIGTNSNLSNTTTTGQKFLQAQRAMQLATQALLNDLADTPPLQFLVNPQSFKVNSEKVVTTGNWTRYGPATVVEHWGDGQDKIEGSGKVAAFMAIDFSGQTLNSSQGPGLTRTARHYSAAYQNFLSLYLIYRNNAGLYMPDGLDSNQLNLTMLGSIYIYYDHTLYIGSFDDFSISETDTGPYTLEYSFSFTVRATFLLDQITDPNHTYGIPKGGFTVQSPATIPTSQAATLSSGQSQPQFLPNGDINTANQSDLTFAQIAALTNQANGT